jgi:iron complex transport system substrate-binding protein
VDQYSTSLLGDAAPADVGNPRQLSAEGILSLAPTLVLMTDSAGPPEVIEQVRKAGVTVVALTHDKSVDGVRALIEAVGDAVDVDVSVPLADFDADCLELPIREEGRTTAMFVYSRGPSAMNVSGTDTAGHAMLDLAGLDNAVRAYEGYKPFTPEAAVAADPDWLVLTTRGFEAVGGAEGLAKVPGLADLRAVREGRVTQLDDFQLLAFGLETCAGARALATQTGTL